MRERWQKVDEVLHRAMELRSPEREDFVARATADDPELAGEVRSLLAAHREAGTFLESPAAERVKGTAEPILSWEGKTIGPYEIVETLGHGGMGTVYLAVRADDAYQKKVAIKRISPGALNEELLQRFRAERQILASLEHPNIARLYDGGTSPEGLPFLVMEYVEGLSIDRFCEEHRLSLEQRLELCQPILDAVSYAHRKLVVHRDIKPGNILVTPQGVPKLLDFGIAKLLAPDGEEGGDWTRTSHRRLTPNYASPEQLRGDQITTASDVYSLGVLLYQLVTGHLPRRLEISASGKLDTPTGQPPTLPSKVVLRAGEASGDSSFRSRYGVPAKQVSRKLRGDLDTILLAALREEPERRYPSVEQLSADLRRARDGLPVQARKDTFGYRAGKFVARNRSSVAAALAFLVLLVGFLVTTVRKNQEIARERDRVAAESEKALLENRKTRQVSAFLQDLLEGSDPWQTGRRDITVREALDRGATSLASRSGMDPQIRALLMETTGSIYSKLGLYDEALAHLERSLELRRASGGDEEIAAGMVSLGAVATEVGDFERAKELLDGALEIRQRVFSAQDPRMAEIHAAQADLRFEEGGYLAAIEGYEAALEIYRALGEIEGTDAARAMNQMGLALVFDGRPAQAEPLFEDSLRVFRDQLGPDHPWVAVTLDSLSEIASRKGDHATAEALGREGVAISRRVFGDVHPDLGQKLNNLSVLLSRGGKDDEAIEMQKEALGIARKVLGDEHQYIALGLSNLGSLQKQMGRFEEAEAALVESLEVFRKTSAPGNPNGAFILVSLGDLYRQTGRLELAESTLRAGVEERRRALGGEHVLTAIAEGMLGGCLVEMRRFEEAEDLLVRSFEIQEAIPGHDRNELVVVLRNLVHLYEAWERGEQGEPYRARLRGLVPETREGA